jgi:hypothetical protein
MTLPQQTKRASENSFWDALSLPCAIVSGKPKTDMFKRMFTLLGKGAAQ